MNISVENIFNRAAEDARGRVESVISAAQDGVERAGDWVTKGKTPVRRISDMTLRLATISHKTTEKLVKHQTKTVESTLDAAGARLKAAARAESLGALVKTQANLIPATTSRVVDNVRGTVTIFGDAAEDVGEVVKSTVTDFRQKAVKPAKKTAKKKAAKTKKKAAKKTRRTATKVAKKARQVETGGTSSAAAA
ncbi:phasin family protein [Lentisalinibacter orientalis]|uniref:phasin family protein n=1 Tax=Lentisalinibacter orientalis TaxID=2992241 RepID=UPI00386A609F